ncbi:hypothetical protein SAMN04489758_101183 [Thomasclavelia cocleata]|uniref:Uncharacterized protein n=1 Tax=Thomasclavelia cocleata TaxID=69824 RepID=A0A1I0BNZ4_9FIRM|nr:hypothetical protein [Thomasclavelia cocleata]MCR1960183.1 hypothetical protein [Thomasclavelia cocleata]NDO41843.1 hypothetical protein [Thomasclavelia cocleata]SET08017.1 hypothetical protein SAMN04489758_101183 [Thomasclavelia cocleata]
MPNFIKKLFSRETVSNKCVGTVSLSYLLIRLKSLFVAKNELIDKIYPIGIVIGLKDSVDPSIVLGGDWWDITSKYVNIPTGIKKWQRIVVVTSNKTSLQKTYNQYKNLESDKYIESSWLPFAVALEKAHEILEYPGATQKEVDEADTALTMAYIGLRLKPTN